MILVIWHFTVAPENRLEFEAAYGEDGSWVRLFRQSPEHIATKLMKDPDVSGGYFTLDYWVAEEFYNRFRSEHAEEYDQLDRSCDSLTEREELIGRLVI